MNTLAEVQSTHKVYSLNEHVTQSVTVYLQSMQDVTITEMYDTVLAEVEEPLLKVIMRHVKFNQSSAARLLGISRGTLRKKLERYGMLVSD